jgi:hypothetical protein
MGKEPILMNILLEIIADEGLDIGLFCRCMKVVGENILGGYIR